MLLDISLNFYEMRVETQLMLHLVLFALIASCLADAGATNTVAKAEARKSEECAFAKYHPDNVVDPSASISDNSAKTASATSVRKRAPLINGIRNPFARKGNNLMEQSVGGFFTKLLGKSSKAELQAENNDIDNDTDDESGDEGPTVPDYTESDTFGFDISADVDLSIEDPQDMKDYFEKEYYDKQKESDDKYYDYFDILEDVANYKGGDDYDDLQVEKQEAGDEAMFDANLMKASKKLNNAKDPQQFAPQSSQTKKFVQFPDGDQTAPEDEAVTAADPDENSSEDTANSKIRIIGDASYLVPSVRKVRTPVVQSDGFYDSDDEGEESEQEDDSSSVHGGNDLGVATRISVAAPLATNPFPASTPLPSVTSSVPLVTIPTSQASSRTIRQTLVPSSRSTRGRPPLLRKPELKTTANSTSPQNNLTPYPYLFFKDSLSGNLKSSYAALLIVPVVVIALV